MVGLIGESIKYSDGYAGQLREDAVFQLPRSLWPPEVVENEFIRIDATGIMRIRASYAWDYASVPGHIFWHFSNWFQGNKSRTPSLAHDALCQLERAGLLNAVPDARKHADEFFLFLLNERHFFKWRARAWFDAVRIGAKAKGSNKPILEAP